MRGRLNIFQQTMLKWNEFHPYNAIDLVGVQGVRLEPETLRNTINKVIEHAGTGRLQLSADRREFEYADGAYAVDLKIIRADGDMKQAINNEMALQLNEGFDRDGYINPFRFFAAEDEESFYLGVVYFHAIAGDDVVILLVKDIVDCYSGNKRYDDMKIRNRYPLTYMKLLRPGISGLLESFLKFPNFLSDLRRSYKPYKMYHVNDQETGYAHFSLGRSILPSLVARSREWGVTLNDIFLAVILKVIGPFAKAGEKPDKNRVISVGVVKSIVDDLCVDPLVHFGVFLSSFIVSHPVPAAAQVEILARDVRRQTYRIKRKRLYLQTLFEKWLALMVMPLFPRTEQMRFYPKHYPLWAGITNINLNTLWDQSGSPCAIDYFRAVSTGPNCPVVFSITTVREAINVGLSFRLEVFSRDDIEKISADFSRYLDQISDELKGERQ